MSMRTQLLDAGTDEPRVLPHGWGGWHLEVLAAAVAAEGGTWAEAFDPGWVFAEAHAYHDPDDGEVLVITPGDTFRWWWN
jgi:hypothetical protein